VQATGDEAATAVTKRSRGWEANADYAATDLNATMRETKLPM
jgi:hypothetical protein